MTNLQTIQTAVQTYMGMTNQQLTALAIACGEITSCDDTNYTNFQLAVMVVSDKYNVFIDGTSVNNLQII